MRHLRLAAAATALLLSPYGIAFGQGGSAGLTITNYTLQGEERVSRSQWYVTYRADLANTGAARTTVTATLKSAASNVQLVPGQSALHFAPVPANSTVKSIDTFTVLVDRSTPFDVSTLVWSFLNPVANAGFNQTATIGKPVTLSGAASTNPSGVGTLSYRWSLDSRPARSQATLTAPTNVISSFVPDTDGAYVLSLEVSNGAGSDTASVRVSTSNSPPVANAGPNQTAALNSTVVLNGGASWDADGDPLTYQWSMITHPPNSVAELIGTRALRPTFVVDQPGIYIAQLIVNDGTADSAPATVRITTLNTPPVANAGSNQTVGAGALVQLNGSQSTDVDGDTLTYRWTLPTRPTSSNAALSNPSAVNPTFTADQPGVYVAQLIVNDGQIDSAPATVTITTNAVQRPIANAGANQSVVHGTIVTLNGSCTDPQLLPCTLAWSLTTRPTTSSAVLSSPSASQPTFVADVPGVYVAQLIASNGVQSSLPATVTITTTNTPPVANAGQNRSVFTAAVVPLDGGSSFDADRDTLSYSWSFTTRPSGSSTVLQNPTGRTPSFFADVAGTYVVQLIVNDGFTNSDPVTVTISANSMAVDMSPNPLNLSNSPASVTVMLSVPAGQGGVTVTFSGFDPSVISLPTTAFVPANSGGVNVTVTPLKAGNTTILASAPNYQPFSLPVNVTTPALSITSDHTAVGVGRSITATVSLSGPAPAGGVVVALSGPSALVSMDPAQLTIPAGQTAGTVQISGVAPGPATVSATAAGYSPASLDILVVKLGGISLPSNLTVAPGQSVNLDVRLALPAPVGGVTISLVSGNTSILTVPSSVFIAQGATVPSTPAQVTGVAFGATTVSASALGFDGDTQTVKVGATLSFSSQAVTVGAGGAQSVNLLLSAPAPAGGLVANLVSSAPSAVSVPATVPFAAGATSASVTITSTGNSNTSAIITASTTTPNIASGTVNVSVVVFGAINVPPNLSAGVGQSVACPITLTTPAPVGGVTVTLSTSSSGVATITPATLTIPAGQTQPATQPQFNAVAPGPVSITVSAPGYGSTTQQAQSTLALSFDPLTLSLAGSESRDLTLKLSAPAPAGGLAVNLSASPSGIVTYTSTITVPASQSQMKVTFTGASPGNTTVTATAANPAISNATATITVLGAGAISLPTGVTLTPGQTAAFALTLSSPAPQAGVTVSLSSDDTSKVSISPATVTVPAGQTQPNPQPQVTGVNFGSAVITATAPTYTNATQTVTVGATLTITPATAALNGPETRSFTVTLSTPAPQDLAINLTANPAGKVALPAAIAITKNATSATFDVTGVSAGTATITAAAATAPNITSGSASVTVQSAGAITLPSGVTVGLGQSAPLQVTLPAPAPNAVTVSLSSSNANKVTISPATVTIAAGQTQPATAPQVTGIDLGTADITASANLYTSGTKSVQVTGSISLAPQTLSLATTETKTLTLTLSGPAPAGGMTFNVNSSSTSIATVGAASVTIPASSTTASISVSGVAAGSATIRVTGSNVADATAAITVTPSVDIIMPATLTVAPGDIVALSVRLARTYQQAVFLTLSSSDTAKAIVSPSGVTIAAGQTVPSVPIQVTGVATGTTDITAQGNGITLAPATTAVTVGFRLTLSPSPLTIVGNGNNATMTIQLSGPAPAGGLQISLSSSNTGVVTLPSDVFLSATSTTIGVRLTSVSAGTATIRANAPGVPEAAATVNVVAPGAIILTGPATVGLSQEANLNLSLTTPAPAGGVTIELTTSDSRKVGLSQASVTIPANATMPLAPVKVVGVNVGGATIGASAGGYASPAPLTVQVGATVTWLAPNTQISGIGKQAPIGLQLGATAPQDGLTVNLSSSDPTVATVQPSAVFVWNGSPSPTVSVTVTSVGAGTATIHASGTNIPDVTTTVTVLGPLSITTSALPGGQAGAPYSGSLAAAGGVTPYTWSASGLPAGLSINAATGVISGTPSAPGTSTVTVSVADATQPTANHATKDFVLNIGTGFQITTGALPSGTVGAAYSAPLAASGGVTPYTWSASGLPSGLSIDPSTGTISGTPSAQGSPTVTVSVTDSTTPTHLTASKTFTLTIGAGVEITTASLPAGVVGAAYSATVAATGGTGSYSWSASGLPSALSINASTGVISGVPASAGSSTVTVTATDTASHMGTKQFTLTVSQGLTITTASLPDPALGAPYSATVAASGGTTPYSWSATGLPAGLSINISTGVISGTPLDAGSSTVAVTVTDATAPVHLSASKNFTLSIGLGLTLSPTEIGIRGNGNQAMLTLTLSAPAPAGGIELSLSSSNPAVATVPSFAFLSATSSSVGVRVMSVSAGTAVIHVSGPGIPDHTATVTVLPPGTISVTGPANVNLAATGTLNISLSTPAPAGGVTVQLASSDPTKVSLGTTVVTIPQDATVPAIQPTIKGENTGAATITATANGYTSGAPLVVNVRATVTWETQNATIVGLGQQILLTLRLSATAPMDGLTVNLSSSNPSVATIQATGIFIWDGSNAPGIVIPVTSVGSGTTTIHASGVNVPDATTTVTVVGPLSITSTALPNGVTGVSYSATVTAAGGTAPYSWSATGLPAGLSINPSTGAITGTPSAAGTATPNILVTDASSPTHQSATKQFTFNITQALTITTTTLPVGLAGTRYYATVTAIGGTPPYSWSAVNLPAGLSIDPATGVISGTPTVAGSPSVSFTVTDTSTPTHLTKSADLTIAIAAPLGIATTSPLPNGFVGVPYTAKLLSSGGVGPYGWSAAGLPGGLELNTLTGDISGTPTTAGMSTVTITVTDSSTPVHQVAGGEFTITISAGLSIITTALPSGVIGTAYSLTVQAGGGTKPYSWSATGLPAGLSMNATTGEISGTPTTAGPNTVSVTVSDSTTPTPLSFSKDFAVSVVTGCSNWSSSAPSGVVGTPYSFTVSVSCGVTPYTFAATGLPAGLSINPSSGVISGTPTASGTSHATITVTDSTTPTPQVSTGQLTIVINDALSITTASLPSGAVSSPYSATVLATGGQTPYAWSAVGLPAGLSINAATGAITGTPTASATTTPDITVCDAESPQKCVTKRFTIAVTAVLSITTTSISDGVVNTSYSSTVSAAGGATPYAWSATGLPTGLTINTSTGVISGTPTATGPFTIKVTVTDATSPTHQSVSKDFPITIAAGLSITTSSLPDGVVTGAYSSTVTAAGGVSPYTWSATGLPAGLTISSTGVISGTPTTAGSPTVNFTVTDSANPTHQTATRQLTLKVVPAPSITTSSLPDGVAQRAYSVTLTASDGTSPYSWAATGLPAGLTVNANTGVISGTPTGTGTSTVQLTVTDSTSPTHLTASKPMTLTIAPVLSITTSALPSGVATSAYSTTVGATGGSTPYSWSATGLPSGLSINPTTGVISGTPTAAGTNSVDVTVTDAAKPTPQTATAHFTLTIGPALSITTSALTPGFSDYPYSFTILATGGTPSYSWSATGLPTGLTMNATTGVISGTPAAAGTSPVTITATDSTSPTHQIATKQLTLVISPGLVITTSSLPDAYTGNTYSATAAASGGTSPYSWSATGLPAGLSISSAGAITGTPTVTGTVSVVLTATDSTASTPLVKTRAVPLTVKAGLAIVTTALAAGPAGSPYSFTMTASGGTMPYTWSATGLPSGFAIDPATGVISGSPTTTSTSQVNVTVTDSTTGTHLVATKPFTLTIGPSLSIITTSLPPGVVTSAYSLTLAAAGGTTPYTWSATGLPAGLSLNAASGVISGTPTAPSSGTVNITVTDATNPTHQTVTVQLSLVIAQRPTIVPTSLPSKPAGMPYSFTLTAKDGTPPYSWSATGLPDTFTLDAATGVLSGNPTAASTSNVVVTVTDSTAPTALKDSKQFTLTITPPLSITTASPLTSGVVNHAYTATLAATGGITPYTWAATGLPAGLSINQTSGVISGTPTAEGTSTVTVTVTDSTSPSAKSVSKDFSLVVKADVVITTAGLPRGITNAAYSFTLAGTGGTTPYTWSSNDLPQRLAISSGGTITGTPLNAGTFSVHITLTDSTNPAVQVTKAFTLQIDPQLTLDTTALTDAIVGVPYSFTPVASGGVPPYVWSATGLPAGLSITPASGVISGIPSSLPTTYSVVLTVTDTTPGTPQVAPRTLSLVVINQTAKITVSNANVGQNLQTPITITFSPAPAIDTPVTISSNNPDVLLGSPGTGGSSALTATVPANQATISTYVKASAASGTATITVTASGYATGTGTITLFRSGFVIASPGGIGAAYETYQQARSTLTVYASRLDASGLFAEAQQIRGLYSIDVPITVSPAYGTASPSTLSFTGATTSLTSTFTAGQTSGVATISVGQPFPFVTPSSGASVVATIKDGGILPCTATPITIGKNLQTTWCQQLTSPSLTGPVPMTITSNEPSRLMFSTSPTGSPSNTITMTVPKAQTFTLDFYIHAYDGPGTTTYTASAPGFGSRTFTVNLAESGFVIQTPYGMGANFTIATNSPNAGLGIYPAMLSSGAPAATQPLAAGVTVSVTVSSNPSSVGRILTSPISLNGGDIYAVTQFQPVAAGTTIITASANGWTSAGVQATVQAPSPVLPGGLVIGQYLQDSGTVILPSPAPAGGLHMTLTSNSPLLKLSTAADVVGSSTITLDFPAGQSFATLYMQSLGTSGTVTYTASAPGYSDATQSVDLMPSGIVILGPFSCAPCTFAAGSGPQALNVYTARLTASNDPDIPQNLAPGAAVTVSLTNTNPAVGTVPATVTMQPNNYVSTAVFTPVGTGTTTVGVTAPSGWQTPGRMVQLMISVQ